MSYERPDDRAPAYVAVGRFLLEIGESKGAALREAASSERARFRPRVTPILLRPSLIRGLVDRRSELAAAVSATDSGIPVEVRGEPGIGKTAVLRHLAHHPRASLVDGTVYLSARHQSSFDLRQRIFDAFYESETPGRPTDMEIRSCLQDKHALILLDDISLTQHELEEILDVAPRCAFVVATRERAIWDEARSVALTGIPDEDATMLLERELERALDPEERSWAAALCAAVGGHPRRIRQVAAIIRERGIPLDTWQEHIAPDNLIADLLTSIDEKQRRVLLALAALPTVPIHLQHVSGSAELTDVESLLTTLARRGLVTSHQSRYRLADGVADRLRRTEDLKPSVNRAITYFTAWADRHRRSHEQLLETADALLCVQEDAADERRWGEALRLGRLLERTLVTAGRWGAWGIVLERCLSASKAIGDRAVEAWTLHEIGTRAVCLGDADTARRVLGQAANLRKELGETAAAALSRRNLEFIVTAVSAEQRMERSARPSEDVNGKGNYSPPDHRQFVKTAVRARMIEAGALALSILLFAALGGFTYQAVWGRGFRTEKRSPSKPLAPAAAAVTPSKPGTMAEPPTPAAAPPSQGASAARRANILIFTARPGSIVTRRPTDICYAVSGAVQTRIEPTIGNVDITDALTCRRVAPVRTTTYELTAVGRDGIPVSKQLVIVVR